MIPPSKLNGRVHHSYHSHRENWKQREINQAAKKARIDAGGYTGAKTPKPAPAPKTKAAPKAKTPKGPAAAPIVVNELICRRVQRFWPDEGGWFDAIITDYRPTTNEHCLTYEINTPNETFEWADISKFDGREFKLQEPVATEVATEVATGAEFETSQHGNDDEPQLMDATNGPAAEGTRVGSETNPWRKGKGGVGATRTA